VESARSEFRQHFGAFVELAPGVDALLHVSQISRAHVEKPSDVLAIGQEITVNREFEEHGPRKILLTDITYIINGKAPRCYMSTIIDACTKELLSWVLSESLEIDFVLETVKQLIEKHGTNLSTETLIHSDQGSHYTSIKFIQLLKDNELRQSMSRRANCWDNAPQESAAIHQTV
jgi:transposase InsO family protein